MTGHVSHDMRSSSLCQLCSGFVRVIQHNTEPDRSAMPRSRYIPLVLISGITKSQRKDCRGFECMAVGSCPSRKDRQYSWPNFFPPASRRPRKRITSSCNLMSSFSQVEGNLSEPLLAGLITPRSGANFRAHWSLMTQSFGRELKSI